MAYLSVDINVLGRPQSFFFCSLPNRKTSLDFLRCLVVLEKVETAHNNTICIRRNFILLARRTAIKTTSMATCLDRLWSL